VTGPKHVPGSSVGAGSSVQPSSSGAPSRQEPEGWSARAPCRRSRKGRRWQGPQAIVSFYLGGCRLLCRCCATSMLSSTCANAALTPLSVLVGRGKNGRLLQYVRGTSVICKEGAYLWGIYICA
jgi:hypothetical protein